MTSTAKNVKIKDSLVKVDIESCRVCMSRSRNMKNLFEESSDIIREQITFCTGVMLKDEDGIPTSVCKLCQRNLSIAYKFKTRCILSDETFHRLIKIKEEVTDNSDADELNNDCTDNERLSNCNNEINTEQVSRIKELAIKEEALDELCSDSVKINIRNSKPVIRKNRFKRNGVPSRFKKHKFRKLFCETCNIKFENKTESDKHKKELHKESETWVCEICGKKFVHRASLYTHVRSHLPPQNACDYCEYRTCNKHDLIKHLRIHTGDKRYKCDQCPSAYHNASNLRSHTRRQHERVRPFPCPRTPCEKAFYDRTKLNRHLDSHDEVKRYMCDLCHSRFTRRCYWKKHLLRQHNVVVPPQKSGRQKENFRIGDHPDSSDDNSDTSKVK